MGMELQFLLFVAQTTCIGRHALKVAELRNLVFGEGWGAFLTTLVGSHTYPVAYEHAGVSFGHNTPSLLV